jgi:PAS domain S-box-containing protein
LITIPVTYYYARRRFVLSHALEQTRASKQEAESSLRLREERYFHLFNSMLDPVFVYLVEEDGTPGPFVEVNDAACRLLGYTRDELMTKSRLEVTPSEFQPTLLGAIRKISPQGATQIESELIAKDGKRYTVESKGQSYTSEGKTYLIAIARDITERKKVEIELKNLNRALRMIGDCNQVLVRAKDERELLIDICRIAAGTGGYRMAWVGYAEQDETKTVKPVASAGFEEGYLESANISWANVPRGRGPTGTAIRTKEPVTCRDFQTDPQLLPWREEAARRGYRSSVALPLISGEQCLGALTIYSAEANRFGADEEKLLIELANDLAYGITALRMRVEHEKDLAEIENLSRFPAESPSPVLRIDVQGRLLYHNEAGQSFLKTLKVSRAGIVSAAWLKRITEVLDSGHAKTIEVKLGERIMEVRMAPIQERGYVNLYGQDITERNQAEEKLHEQAELLDLAHDAILVRSLESEIVFWYRGAEQTYGWTSAETMGKISHALLHTIFPVSREAVDKALLREGAWEGELTHTRRDGAQIIVASRQALQRDESGQPVGILEINRDITERKLAEKALIESEDKFKYVFDYSVIGKSITSIDGKMHVNKAFCDMLGYSVEELQNKNWQEISYPDDIEMNQKALDLVMSGEQKSARLTKRYLKKDGSIMWGDLSTALRRDNEGKPLYYFTSLIDITERKNAEDRIRELNAGLEQRVKERTAQLEAINHELETFTYSVSHDLKAPLRGIDGYSQLLLEDYRDKLDENGQTFLKNIRSAAENMNRLIQDLLAYSRMERRSYASAEIDIRQLIESLLSERSDEIASKNIQISVDIPFEQLRADIDGLSAVLRNLLDNAIKFTAKVEQPRIEVGGEEKGDVKVLWVRDNGIGFEMQYAERIFEIFQRLQRVEDYPGTGVGLAIVHKAMQRMGGRVLAESEPGKGATFYLEFGRTA